MILPDVNVLLYAFRPDVLGHARYATWLEAQVNEGTPFGMSPQALATVIRIATNPRAFADPNPLAEVVKFASSSVARAKLPGDSTRAAALGDLR